MTIPSSLANLPHMKKFLTFSDTAAGTIQLINNHIPMGNQEFAEKFPGVKGMKYDSCTKRVAPAMGGSWKELHPVTRVIRYKSSPSLHVCNAKCMGGNPNGTCECSCGGKNHGRAGFTVAAQ